MKYELLYLVAASKEADLEKIKAGAQEIVTTEDGVFDEKEVVEKRKLAYEIKHETHGFYVARRFELTDLSKLQEITRKLNLYTDILRSVISRADELPELKTKEERIKAASARTEKKPTEAKKTAPQVKAVTPIAAPTKETAPATTPVEKIIKEEKASEDIDKKLEEILNI